MKAARLMKIWFSGLPTFSGILIAAGPALAAGPSFSKDIAPLLEQRCSICHLSEDQPGGMALYADGAYDSLVGKPSVGSKLLRVKPGAPQESYLIRKLEGTHAAVGGSGERMPMGGEPVDAATMKIIADWIRAGAEHN